MTKPNVIVIDAGLGNIGSVIAALQRQECSVFKATKPSQADDLAMISHLILPGVGAFNAGVDALKMSGWEQWIKEKWRDANKPLLGICLGMQLLATHGSEGSNDDNYVEGLDLIPGKVDKLVISDDQVLPHVGWNSLDWRNKNERISEGLPNNGDMYFVHSYRFETKDKDHCLAKTTYGEKFCSVVRNQKFYGVQFHPEKSQRLGSRLIKNFLELK